MIRDYHLAQVIARHNERIRARHRARTAKRWIDAVLIALFILALYLCTA